MTRPTSSNTVKFFNNKGVNSTIRSLWLTGDDQVNAAIAAFQARERIKIVSTSFKPDVSILVALDGRVFVFGKKAGGLIGRPDSVISPNEPALVTGFGDTKIVKVTSDSPMEVTFFSNDGRVYISSLKQGRYPDPEYYAVPECPLPSGLRFSKAKHGYYLAENGRDIYYIARGFRRDADLGSEALLLTRFPKGTRIVDFKLMPDHTMVYFTDKGDIYQSSLRRDTRSLDEHAPIAPVKITMPRPLFSRRSPRVVDVSRSPSRSALNTLFLGANGRVYSQGENFDYQLGHGDQTDRKQPTEIKALSGDRIIKALAGNKLSVFLSDRGEIFLCGNSRRFGKEHGTAGGLLLKKITKLPDFSCLDIVDIRFDEFPHQDRLLLTSADGRQYECRLQSQTGDVYTEVTAPADATTVTEASAGQGVSAGAGRAMASHGDDDSDGDDYGAGVGLGLD